MGGLFSKHALDRGQQLARYEGEEYYPPSKADDVEEQSYMFKARMVKDRRKFVVIDGNPDLYRNLAGFANYAEGDAANAHFVDEATSATDPGMRTNIILYAAKHIPAGTEIRVDYDVGSSGHPFRDQMCAKGIPLSALRDTSYSAQRWLTPGVKVVNADIIPKRLHKIPLVKNVTLVRPFESSSRSPVQPTASRSPDSGGGSRSPNRSPKQFHNAPMKRPRGRPPKGKKWDPNWGYV
jgi:hypothetical protein